LQRLNGAVKLRFSGGLTATLLADHPDHDLLLRQAERSLRRREPVGVIVDGTGCLVDLNHTYHVSVSDAVADDADGNRLLITFWGFGVVCYLPRDHPDFERIRSTLETARVSGSRVWFATRTWPVQGESETWNLILDVRAGGRE
jgi:hypothetical protein